MQADDQHLLGIEWLGMGYCDKALPFGLNSAPKVFTAVADVLAQAMVCKEVWDFLHYKDDLFFCAPLVSSTAAEALRVAVPLCSELGLLVAHPIDNMTIPRWKHLRVHLNLQCKTGLHCLVAVILAGWNGVAFLPKLHISMAVVADASGSWGCRAYTHKMLEWFQLPWPLS